MISLDMIKQIRNTNGDPQFGVKIRIIVELALKWLSNGLDKAISETFKSSDILAHFTCVK